jgi:hypothetical protein
MLHYKMEVTAKMKEIRETLMVYCYCIYSRTRLKRHRFMRHLVYSVRYPVLAINSTPLTIILCYWFRKTFLNNDTK